MEYGQPLNLHEWLALFANFSTSAWNLLSLRLIDYWRLLNLELYLKYGAEIWKIGNSQNNYLKEGLEEELDNVKSQIEGINQERKLSQVSTDL